MWCNQSGIHPLEDLAKMVINQIWNTKKSSFNIFGHLLEPNIQIQQFAQFFFLFWQLNPPRNHFIPTSFISFFDEMLQVKIKLKEVFTLSKITCIKKITYINHFTIVGGNDFREIYILCSISNIEEANIWRLLQWCLDCN